MASLSDRRILITGATGFIGAALARRLVRERAEVHILARPTSSPERLGPAWSRLTRHLGDLGDGKSLAAAVKKARPEFVFHLARERDGATFERQAKATRLFAAALRAHAPGLKRWVRTAHAAPSRENDASLSRELSALGLPVVTLELFLVYGPGQGENDFPRSFRKGKRPPSLSGAVKDFVFIDDVVEAYCLAAQAPDVEGLTIPIGTGQGRSEAEAAAVLLRMTGSTKAAPSSEAGGEGHPADPSLARRVLGWNPRVLLEQGLARTFSGARLRRPNRAEERRHMIPWLGVSGVDRARSGRGVPRSAIQRSVTLLPWSLIHSAAAHFRAGDLKAAGRDADAFIGLLPASAAGPAIKALVAAQEGDRVEAERWLEASGPQGPTGWAQALRGMMRVRWGEFDAARGDLDATRRIERSAWALAERADVYNRVGLYWKALKELEELRRLLPSSPEPDSRAAAIHLEQAQYAEAGECLARAVRLAPRDASLRRQLSGVRFVEGDLLSARRAMVDACRLAPENLSLRQELLRLCILLDDDEACEARLQETWPEGVRDYWLAYMRCRQGRFDESRALFGAAEKSCGDRQLAQRAVFYRHIASVLRTAPTAAPPAGQELLVMGLGFRHPYQVSVEVLWSLRRSEAFFSNLSDSTVADMLGLFGVPMRTIVFRRSDGQSTACARIVMKGMKTLRRGAVVTRGQPVYYGRLAHRLVLDCARRGIDCRVPPSVSIADFFPSLVGRVRGEDLGMQVRDTSSKLETVDARLPVVLYNFTSGAERLALCRRLQSLYASEEPCWLLAGSGHLEYEPRETTFGALEPALMRADAAVTLLLPARPAKMRKRPAIL